MAYKETVSDRRRTLRDMFSQQKPGIFIGLVSLVLATQLSLSAQILGMVLGALCLGLAITIMAFILWADRRWRLLENAGYGDLLIEELLRGNNGAVFQANDKKWWYWDEVWAYQHGPYKSEDEARAALAMYLRSL